MDEAIKVLKVEQIGDSAVEVTFSNGKTGLYSAELLASINVNQQRTVPFRDRFWITD